MRKFRITLGLLFVLGVGWWLGNYDSGIVVEGFPANLNPTSNHTVTFQQGLDGYMGVADTWVSSNDWGTPPQYSVNYGQNEALQLDRDGGDNPLLRFDLSSIPANSNVISATLSLYNTTGSCNDGACSTPHIRRVRLYQILPDWDEGNQVASPIDASGKHGATGDCAFRYYSGEGADVVWGARGMARGTDYASAAESSADVVDAGWYTWDVSALVRAWVRGEQPNYGLVLRDATGWEEENTDWRSFHSSQYTADPALRPRLVVTYNPDVPYVDAGMDQEILQWDGTVITLDGSASHDRPGGNDSTLVYQWRILTPAYDSAQSGVIGSTTVITFTPDVAGEWDFQLTVSNDLGESASDGVHVRLLRIPATHPRIYLTPARLATLRARATADNIRWTQLKAAADNNDGMLQEALVGQITEQANYCTAALAEAQQHVDDDQDCSSCPGDIALVYDWCYDQMSAAQRDDFIAYFNHRGDNPSYGNFPGWGNYWPRHGYSLTLMGLATYGDNPRAQEWLDAYRYDHIRDNDTAILDQIAAGGGWPEGMVYDWIANVFRVKATAAWTSATGERLFASTSWYRERLGYLLLHQWPGTAQEWGRQYHPYPSTGDSERNRGTMANYGRIMALILVNRFPNAPLAPQLRAYLATVPDDNSDSFLYYDEFLWFDPDLPTATPSLRTHYAAGAGTIFMRSGWPSGAADTDTSATYLTFQVGDHFTYHQHYDQNSFTLFKYTDLALDSGVYSGDGLSEHDKNYFVRTIAHNTLVVYNPDENFEAARPETTSNDGGQRSMYPASRAPETVTYFAQHRAQYDTGDMLRFEDTDLYTYALGDATQAYNNPAYNQAMAANSAYSGSVAKVSRFQRELVYLRPLNGDSRKRDYVVLLDRVGVTEPRFSGANTKLLFHFFDEPTVNGTGTAISDGETLYTDGNLIAATNGEGKLFVKTLLPTGVHLRKVGGRGQKAFWVFDANYDWQWSASEAQPRPTNDFEDVPYGEWRVEMEPPDTALDHTFLTVLHPTASSTTAMPATHLIQAEGGMTGVHITDGELDRVTLFSAATDGSAPSGIVHYTITPAADALNLLFDLPPNARYALTTSQNGDQISITLTPAGGGASQTGHLRPAAGTRENANSKPIRVHLRTSASYLQASSQGVLSFTLSLSSGGATTPTVTPTSTPTLTSTPTSTLTSTLTPTPSAARFAIIGDYGSGSQNEAAVAALVKDWKPDFIVTLGDNNYPDGAASTIDTNIGQFYHDFISPYGGSYGSGATSNCFYPALGNHDWRSLSCSSGTCRGPYFDYFTLPGNERYYDFTWGPVQFFVIDSDYHEPDGRSSTSIQASWLRRRLTESAAAWKLVAMHHPPYSSASVHGSETVMQWPYQAWGADAVLAGHDHTYERLLIDDFPYFVNGVGGASRYGFGAPLPGSQVRYNSQYGAMLVKASPDTITFQFVDVSGAVVDTYTLTKSAPTPTATVTPTPTGALANIITYSRDNGHVYRIAAQANATPEDVSVALDALSPRANDALLNISPDGGWLVLETERFDPNCAGWACLAVVKADLSRGDVVRSGGNVVHPDGGISAIASGGDLVVYPDTSGPHTRDLYVVRRSNGTWGAPMLLTGASTYQLNSQPALAADGSRLLFDCDNDINDVGEAICEVHTDGSGFRVVLTPADSPGPRHNPLHSADYAPDGSIVFEGDWDGETVWRLPVDSTTPVKVGSFNNDNSPCVLPDGQIASLWMDRPGGPSLHEIKVMSNSGHSYFMALSDVDVFDVGLGCGGNDIPPQGFCVQDTNANGVGDVVDILATANRVGCDIYLPVIIDYWRQPWPNHTGLH